MVLIDERCFQGLRSVMDNDWLVFEVATVVSEKVSMRAWLEFLFDDANIFVKALPLLFTEISIVHWERVCDHSK